MSDEPEDPQAVGNWTPDTSRGLPPEIGSAIGGALPWLEAREREARTGTGDAGDRTSEREATIARLTEIADQIRAGHVPAGVRACGPGGRVIAGPAEISEPEAGN